MIEKQHPQKLEGQQVAEQGIENDSNAEKIILALADQLFYGHLSASRLFWLLWEHKNIPVTISEIDEFLNLHHLAEKTIRKRITATVSRINDKFKSCGMKVNLIIMVNDGYALITEIELNPLTYDAAKVADFIDRKLAIDLMPKNETSAEPATVSHQLPLSISEMLVNNPNPDLAELDEATRQLFERVAKNVFLTTTRKTRDRMFWLLWNKLGQPVDMKIILSSLWPLDDQVDAGQEKTTDLRLSLIRTAVRDINNVKTPDLLPNKSFFVTTSVSGALVLKLKVK